MSKFKTRQSGTPAAGPKGAMNRSTLATQALLDGEAELPDPESGGTCKGDHTCQVGFVTPHKGNII